MTSGKSSASEPDELGPSSKGSGPVGGEAFPLPFEAVFLVEPGFCAADFLAFSLLDMIVGGSCKGSPARISFLPLSIGIQQTYYDGSIERKSVD